MLSGTWNKPDIFQALPRTNILQLHNDTVHALRERFPQYAWAFRDYGRILSACVLPIKRQKTFTSCRPIVSFAGCFARLVFTALAYTIHLLVPNALAQSLKHKDVWFLLTDIHTFFATLTPRTVTPSTTRTWRVFSLHILWARYLAGNPQHAEYFTVCIKEKQQRLQVFCAKPTRHQAQRVPDILQAVLQLRYFRVGPLAVKQFRGSPMDNFASPALSVAAVEQLWFDSFSTLLHNMGHLWHRRRYVDNRLTILATRFSHRQAFRSFLHPAFYVCPVLLVDELGFDFLRFVLGTHARRIQFIPPCSLAQFLHPRLASPPAVIRSSFTARLKCGMMHSSRDQNYPALHRPCTAVHCDHTCY